MSITTCRARHTHHSAGRPVAKTDRSGLAGRLSWRPPRAAALSNCVRVRSPIKGPRLRPPAAAALDRLRGRVQRHWRTLTDDAVSGLTFGHLPEPHPSPYGGAMQTSPVTDPSAGRLLTVALASGMGIIFGLLVGCVAVASGVWILALSPASVFVNQFLLLGARIKAMGRASNVWPVISMIVAAVVVVTVPSSAALPLAVLAAIALPAVSSSQPSWMRMRPVPSGVIDGRFAMPASRHSLERCCPGGVTQRLDRASE